MFCLAVDIAVTNFMSMDGKPSLSAIAGGNALILFYIGILIVLVVISLSVKPKQIEDLYKAIVIILGIYQIFVMGIIIDYLITSHNTLVLQTLGFTACGFSLIIIIN